MSKIIENIDDVKLLISRYEWLKDRAINLINCEDDFDEIQNIEFYNDDLNIEFTTYSYGCTEHHNQTVPITWLFLDDEELKKKKKRKKKRKKPKRK